MKWQSVGADGAAFREQVNEVPGWYWIYRPRNIGERAYDPELGVLLPIWVGADGRLSSPLAELQDLDDVVIDDATSGAVYDSWFAGPIHPGEPSGFIEVVGGVVAGAAPEAEGWHWCRTVSPLMHVDDKGVGPIYLKRTSEGEVWVFPAASVDGDPIDIWELGFAEPLTTELGVIDGEGEAGRTRAEFFGAIVAPGGRPEGFVKG